MEFHFGWRLAWLIAVAFIAGVLNAIAGGGSLLSFPALLGVPGILPIPANATNTVALWPGQLTSIAGFFFDLKENLDLVLPVCSAAFLGGLAGAVVLLHTRQTAFLAMVPWLLLFATILFAVSSPISLWLRRTASRHTGKRPKLTPLWLGVAAVCFYVGYFGAGGGLMLMSILAVFGIENINHVNALKVITNAVANGIAVITFIAGREIVWRYCLPMMAAAAVGGFLGAHSSRRLNPRFLRGVVVLIGLTASIYFFCRS